MRIEKRIDSVSFIILLQLCEREKFTQQYDTLLRT